MDEELAPAVAPGQETLDLGDVEPGQYTDPLRFTEMEEARLIELAVRWRRRVRELLLEAVNRRPPRPPTVCLMCHRLFMSWRPSSRWCSNACRQRAYRRRVQRRLAPAPDTQSGPLRE